MNVLKVTSTLRAYKKVTGADFYFWVRPVTQGPYFILIFAPSKIGGPFGRAQWEVSESEAASTAHRATILPNEPTTSEIQRAVRKYLLQAAKRRLKTNENTAA